MSRHRAGPAHLRPAANAGEELEPGPAARDDDGARAPHHLLGSVTLMGDGKRMQLRGLHHVTAISRDLERTIAFYRDLLGLAIVHDGPSDDDPQTRHVWFGALDGEAGQLLSFMQYPELPQGVVGIGSTHHFALVVDSPDEQEAWRDYLRGQGVECTDVFDRGAFRSIYLRDPDGHIVEIATSGPGFRAGGPSSVPPV